MSELSVTFNPAQVTVNLKSAVLSTSTGNPVVREYIEYPAYEGPTEVTPSQETQTLETKNKRMTDNVTINPIPSNYGLITWDGTTITVS